jgi:hypothetical protein
MPTRINTQARILFSKPAAAAMPATSTPITYSHFHIALLSLAGAALDEAFFVAIVILSLKINGFVQTFLQLNNPPKPNKVSGFLAQICLDKSAGYNRHCPKRMDDLH